ncbi:MAG TPA: glycoside hydrolase family 13 protein [Woeseiaceae bacterium]|nr:glycoside hydrolase family 13 protein [Woeseiaceae bacterium]
MTGISPVRLLLPLLALLFASGAGAQWEIEHLEPPFWWTGMQSPTLELMVHGESIAELEPMLDHPGVEVAEVHRTGNSNYLFLELELAGDVAPGSFVIDFRRDGETKLTYRYELRPRETGSADRDGFDASDVIYLVTPDRFANADASNDEVASLVEKPDRSDPHGRHGGDLQGIIDHLDYIAGMGYTQIWLNPVLQNDQPESSYHGYATTDFYQVDARFGDNALYRKLSVEAANRGIGLILDFIPNHSGSEHWWMKDLPSGDWINHGGEFVATTHKRESLFDPNGAESDRLRFSDGWFVSAMPDLNQRNPRLARYLVQNSIWWVEFAGLSGIRVDTWPYSDKEFLAEWARRMLEEYPRLNIVGEEWVTNPAIVAYWQRGTLRQDGYESRLPSLMDFPLHDAVMRGLQEEEGWGLGLDRIYGMLANDFLYGDPHNLVIFPDNHDMSRIFTQLDERFELYKIALKFFLTTRGIPQLYYGDEILMANPGTDAHGVIRGDFPGGWPGDDSNGFTGEGLTELQREAQALTRTLLNWRKSASAIHRGKLTQFAPEGSTYTYFRHDDRQKVMVVINKAPEDQPLDVTRFAEVIGDAERGVDVVTGEEYLLDETFQAPANAALILELR